MWTKKVIRESSFFRYVVEDPSIDSLSSLVILVSHTHDRQIHTKIDT